MGVMWVIVPTIILEEIFFLLTQRTFVERVLHSRRRKPAYEIMAWSLHFVIFNYTTYILTDNVLIYILAFCGSFFAVLWFLYQDPLHNLIYATVFVYMLGMFSEVLAYYMVLIGNRISKTDMGSYDYYLMIAMISKLVWLCLVKMILLLVKRGKGKDVSFRDWIEACFVPVGSIVIIFTFLPSQETYLSREAPVRAEGWLGMACLLGINVVTYYLFEQTKKVAEKQMREEALREQCNYYMRQCEESKALWMELSKFRHDIKQKYIYFQVLLQTGQYEELAKYYQENLKFLTEKKRVADSGNIYFDSILNYKAEIAERDGIRLLTELEVPHDCRINGEDLSICLGNLLDNAIEAVREVEAGQRQIYMKVRVQGSNLYLEIRNPYGTPRTRKRGEYMTTKPDVRSHGWGLQIIREIVDCYHGELDITDENGLFCVKILLYRAVL